MINRGKTIRIPCNCNDIIYRIRYAGLNHQYVIDELTVDYLMINNNDIDTDDIQIGCSNDDIDLWVYASEFGDNIFYTFEDAEERAREMKTEKVIIYRFEFKDDGICCSAFSANDIGDCYSVNLQLDGKLVNNGIPKVALDSTNFDTQYYERWSLSDNPKKYIESIKGELERNINIKKRQLERNELEMKMLTRSLNRLSTYEMSN